MSEGGSVMEILRHRKKTFLSSSDLVSSLDISFAEGLDDEEAEGPRG